MRCKQHTILVILFFVYTLMNSFNLLAQNYYINPVSGNDSFDGKTAKTAFKTLKKASNINLEPGDSLLLAAGVVHWGELKLHNIKGTESVPVIVTSYPVKTDDVAKESTHAIINARGFYQGIDISNSQYLHVSKLHITAPDGVIYKFVRKKAQLKASPMRIGVRIEANKKGVFSGITLDDLIVNNVYFNKPSVTRSFKETHSANGTESYGWGIRAFAKNGGRLDNLIIKNSSISNVSHTGIKLNGRKGSLKNVSLANNHVFDVGGPGMQMSGGEQVHVYGNIVKGSGSTKDTRNWGRGSGMWTWGSSHVLVEYNKFLNANGPGDSAGFHIDFNCDNIIIQYNISANNAGGFIEVLGNNYNNAYRYNVSINDGHRVKKKGVAFQEGKTFWFSGFVGKDKDHNGPFNTYIYNNTIFVKEDIVSKMAVTRQTRGALIANNIFHVMGESKAVKGDQYRPESSGKNDISDVLFTNNIFLKATTWPKEVLIQDSQPIIGDVLFSKPNGDKLTDYIPKNNLLIADKGIEIPLIPGDTKGLFTGLKVTRDILGNPIVGKPDMGAIEISKKVTNEVEND